MRKLAAILLALAAFPAAGFFANPFGRSARSRDMLEGAYDECGECGAPIPAGDWLCADCDDDCE